MVLTGISSQSLLTSQLFLTAAAGPVQPQNLALDEGMAFPDEDFATHATTYEARLLSGPELVHHGAPVRSPLRERMSFPFAFILSAAVFFGTLFSGCFLDRSGTLVPPGDGGTMDTGVGGDGGMVSDGGMGGEGGMGGDGGDGGDGGMMPMDLPPTLTWPQSPNLANNRIYARATPPSEVPAGVTITGYEFEWAGAANGSRNVVFPFIGFDSLTPGSYQVTARANYSDGEQSQTSPSITVVVDDSLRGRFTKNEGSGTTVGDSSGAGLNGTANNLVPASWVQGIEGGPNGAINYDGTDDFVGLGDTFNFDRTTPFSVEAWTSRSALGAGHMIFGRMDFSNASISRGYWLGYESDNRLYFLLRHDNSMMDLLRVRTSPVFSSVSTPQHVTFNYNGSSTGAGVAIFVNGTNQMTDILDDTLTGTTLNGAPARIGAAIANGGDATTFKNVFQGILDDVAIYNRPLTQAEIINNMCAREALNREEMMDATPLPTECN